MAIELQVRSDSRQAQVDLRKLDRSVENINKTTQNATKAIKGLAIGAAGAFAAIGSARAVTNLTDSYRRLEARIALATDGLKEQQKAFKQLNAIAIETRSNQEGVADLYSRIARATKELGIEQKVVIDVTRSISKAITISGSSAESANSAIVQLGQGLAAGALRGQELNSVMEQTPAVAQAIARGMGITIGQLRQFANEGKLTAEAVVGALKDQGKAIDEEFSKVPLTFSQSLAVLGIGVGRVVNEVDQVFGATQKLSAGAQGLGMRLNVAAEGIAASVANASGKLDSLQAAFSVVIEQAGAVASAFAYLGKVIVQRALPTDVILGFKAFAQNLQSTFVIVAKTALPLVRLGHLLERTALSVNYLAKSLRIGPLERFTRALTFGVFDALASVQTVVTSVTSDFARAGIIFSKSLAMMFTRGEFAIRGFAQAFNRLGLEVGGALGFILKAVGGFADGFAAVFSGIADVIRIPYFEIIALQFAGAARVFTLFGSKLALSFSEGLVAGIANGVRVKSGDLAGLFEDIGNALEDYDVDMVIGDVIEIFEALGLVLKILFGNPIQDFKKNLNSLADSAKNVGSSIKNSFSSVVKEIKEPLSLVEKGLNGASAALAIFREEGQNASIAGISFAISAIISPAATLTGLVVALGAVFAVLTSAVVVSFLPAFYRAIASADSLGEAFSNSAEVFKRLGKDIVRTARVVLVGGTKYIREFGEVVINIFKRIYTEVIGNSWWTDTIDGVVSSVALLKKPQRAIQVFAEKVIGFFKNAYIAIIGNSWWTDTIDGVVEKTRLLEGVKGRIASFASSIINNFRDVDSIVKFGLTLSFSILATSISATLGLVLTAVSALGIAINSGAVSLAELSRMSDSTISSVRELTGEFDLLTDGTKAFSNAISSVDDSGVFDNITSGLQGLQQLLRPLGTILADTFGSAISGASTLAILGLIFPFGVLAAAASAVFAKEINSGLNAGLATFGTSTNQILREMGENAGIIVEALVEKFIAALPMLLGFVADIGAGFVRGFLNSIPLIGSALSGTFSILDDLTAGIGGDVVAGGLLMLLFFGKSRKLLFKEIGLAFTTTAGHTAAAEAAKGANSGLLNKLFFGGTPGALGDKIASFISSTKGMLSSAFSRATGYLSGLTFGKEGAASLLQKVKGFASSAMNVFSAGFSRATGFLSSLTFGSQGAASLLEKVKGFASKAFSSIAGIGASFTSGTGSFFEGITFGKEGFKKTAGKLSGYATSMFATIAGIGTSISTAATSFFEKITFGSGGVKALLAKVTAVAVSIFGSIQLIATKLTSGVTSFFNGVLFGKGGKAAAVAETAFAGGLLTSLKVKAMALASTAGSGIVTAALFGAQGIGKAVGAITSGLKSIVARVLLGLTSILLHPVFATIAAIVLAVSALGVLGHYLFGDGGAFDKQLSNTEARVLGIAGILDNVILRGNRQDFTSNLIGEQSLPNSQPRAGLGKQDTGLREEFDRLSDRGFSVTALTGGEFNELAVSIADGVRVQTALYDASLLANTDIGTVARLQADVLDQNKQTVKLLRELDQTLQDRGTAFVEGKDGARDSLNLESGFIESLSVGLARFVDAIGNFIVNIPSYFVRGFNIILKTLEVLASVFHAYVIRPIVNFFKMIGSFFSALWSGVKIATSFVSSLLVSTFETIGDFFHKIKEFFNDPIGAIKVGAAALFESVKGAPAKLVETVKGAPAGAKSAADSGLSLADRMKDAFVGVLTEAPGLIKTGLKEALKPSDLKQVFNIEGVIENLANMLNTTFGGLDRTLSQTIDTKANELKALVKDYKIELSAETTTSIARLSAIIGESSSSNAEIEAAGQELIAVLNYALVNAVGRELPKRLSKALSQFGFEVSQLDLQLLGNKGMVEYESLVQNLKKAEKNLRDASSDQIQKRAQELVAAQKALISQSIALEQKTRGNAGAVEGLEDLDLDIDLEQFSKFSKYAQKQLVDLSDKALSFTTILNNPDKFSFEELTAAQTGLNAITREAERLNEVLGRGDKLANDIRDSFEDTVKGIYDGVNDIGDIFDNVGKQILSTFNDISSQGITDMIFGKKGEDGESGGLGGFLGGIFGSDDSAKAAQDPNTPERIGIGGMVSGAVDGVKNLFGFGGKENSAAAAVAPGTESGGGLGGAIGGMFGGMAPDGTELNPYFVRIVEGMMGGLTPGGGEGGLVGGAMDMLGGEEDTPEAKAAGALEQFTMSIGTAVDGVGNFISGTIQQVLEFLGLSVATSASTSATAKKAASEGLGVIAADSLTNAMVKAAVAAEALGSAMAAAAAKSLVGFSTGGPVSGQGTGTSDSILAHLSNGEYVVNAKSTKKYGPLIEAINSGNVPRFATGGQVGESLPVMNSDIQASYISKAGGSNSGPAQFNNSVTLQVTGDVTEATRKAVREMGNEIATNVQSQFAERGVLNG